MRLREFPQPIAQEPRLSPFSSRNCLAGLGLSIAMLATAAHAAPTVTAQSIPVGQYQVEMSSAGDGPYTVIFESGFGGGQSVWQKVAPAIANSARIVTYSRAGLGKSQPRPEPRTPAQLGKELDELIAAAKLKPPFILVGHSYGGYLIRQFALRHPEQVAGFVFVDPSMERLNAELKKRDPARQAQDRAAIEKMTPEVFRAESKLIDDAFDAAILAPAPALPDVPAVVLTSTKDYKNPDLYLLTPPSMALWRSLHEDLFRSFSTGSHVVTASSGHNIHLEEPGLVISAIQQVIGSATTLAQQRAHEAGRVKVMNAVEEAIALMAKQGTDDAAARIVAALKASGFGEADINQLGYAVVRERKHLAAAALVMKYNADTYPASANAHDSYGEILLEMKQPAAAQAQFQKAIALGLENGMHPKVIEGYRANLAKAQIAR